MDGLTHALAGAMMADCLPYSRRIGQAAPMAGLLAGMAPDLDLVPAFIANFPPKELSFYGLLDERWVMQYHRTYTHSFFYLTLAGIALALIASLLVKRGTWRQWSLVFILPFYSHVVLDLTNPYGVKAWLPFASHDSMWDILPLIDVPLLVAMAVVFVLNHLLRIDGDPTLDAISSWRKRSHALLERTAPSYSIAWAGLAFCTGRILLAYLKAA